VSKVYGAGRPEEVRALTNASLMVTPGEFLSVEGPSGCGKTTLLNLLGLLDVPTTGEIRWDDRSIADRTDRERSRLRLTGVGFIFQRFYLLPSLTARENVELPMRALGRPAAERRERALALLRETGLASRVDAFPHQLSGGEEQRVAIARALANQPGLLLADEPTGELDSTNSQVILNLLTEAHDRTGATVILVTHNPLVAARARRHLGMKDGRIVSDHTTA
jgi:ABC-type lipoprotein export system ATPase subunit